MIGKWEHYAVTLNRTTGKSTIFRDGFPVATGSAPTTQRNIRIGSLESSAIREIRLH